MLMYLSRLYWLYLDVQDCLPCPPDLCHSCYELLPLVLQGLVMLVKAEGDQALHETMQPGITISR